MLRRDFLKAISAFAAAASAGGTAAAGFTQPTKPEPAVWVPPAPAEPTISPAGIVNLTLVRGDDLCLDFGMHDRLGHPLSLSRSICWIGELLVPLTQDSRGSSHFLRLHVPGHATRMLRPGAVPWGIRVSDRLSLKVDDVRRLYGVPPHIVSEQTVLRERTLITGTATILPDDLWRAEEEVLKIVPQMHPLGIIERGDRYEVMFRAPLLPGETSRYAPRVASLLDHCRPVRAEIINGGAGAQIDFACKGLL